MSLKPITISNVNKKKVEESPHLEIAKSVGFNIYKSSKKQPSRFINFLKDKREVYLSEKESGIDVDGKYKKFIHRGQRKLLLSEVDFLVREWKYIKKTINKKKMSNNDSIPIVLYIGAAPGTHITLLASMFPKFEYHLYDKVKYSPTLIQYSKNPNFKIKLFNEYFTDELAHKYTEMNRPIIMITDIRGLEIRKIKKSSNLNYNPLYDTIVDDDMIKQMEWYSIMMPITALFKFRLPWQDKITKYLDGKVYFQCWQGGFSTESRLIPTHNTERENIAYTEYSNKQYEQIMYYFNTHNRVTYYPHDIPYYGHCYDCISEINILRSYLQLFEKEFDLLNINKIWEEHSKEITPTHFDSFTKNNKTNKNNKKGGRKDEKNIPNDMNNRIYKLGCLISKHIKAKLFPEVPSGKL